VLYAGASRSPRLQLITRRDVDIRSLQSVARGEPEVGIDIAFVNRDLSFNLLARRSRRNMEHRQRSPARHGEMAAAEKAAED
jgi:hypothetical protein